jgi:hypothetical protein
MPAAGQAALEARGGYKSGTSSHCCAKRWLCGPRIRTREAAAIASRRCNLEHSATKPKRSLGVPSGKTVHPSSSRIHHGLVPMRAAHSKLASRRSSAVSGEVGEVRLPTAGFARLLTKST